MIIYQYSKCSTCKNALAFFKKHHLPIQVKEINQDPPSIAELEKMLKFQKGNIRKIFNTSGLLYKEMHLSTKLDQMSIDEALKLLSQNGMLIKRPFLLGANIGLVGFKESDWTKELL